MTLVSGSLIALFFGVWWQNLTQDMVSLVIHGTTLVLYLFRELLS